MSLRYQVFHAIRAGRSSAKAVADEVGCTLKSATNMVSRLRCQGMIEGGPGQYKAIASAGAVKEDQRGKHPGSAIGREAGVAKKRNNSPIPREASCLLAECWPEPLKEENVRSDANR